MEKSPISELSELCQKYKHLLPTYKFIQRIDNRFECHIKVFDITEIGIATTKSAAKREAAVKILQNDILCIKQLEKLEDNISYADNLGKTHVSILMEHCQKQLLPVPTFSWTGDITTKQFECTVKAANLTATGVGQNKMKAKHNAAYNLITILNNKNMCVVSTSDEVEKPIGFDKEANKEQNENTNANVSSTAMDMPRHSIEKACDKFASQELVASIGAEQLYEVIDITHINLDSYNRPGSIIETKSNKCMDPENKQQLLKSQKKWCH